MYQERIKSEIIPERISCPQVGCDAQNIKGATTCWNCGGAITIKDESKPISFASQKKKLMVALSLGLLGLIMGYRSLLSISQEKETRENLANNRPQMQGLMRGWATPSTREYLFNSVADVLANNGRFNIIPINIGNREPIEELKQGTITVALIDKVIFAQQLEEARQQGYKLVVTPVAISPIVYIVNKETTGIESLTFEQIEKIYRGEVNNWRKVGGNDVPIKIILFAERNSLNIRFNNSLNSNREFVKNYKEAIKALKDNQGAIFHSSPNLAIKEKEIEIISLENSQGEKVDPIMEIEGEKQPNLAIFAQGKYPDLNTTMMVYLDNGQTYETVMAEKMKDFVISAEGQKLLKESGHVPLYIPLSTK